MSEDAASSRKIGLLEEDTYSSKLIFAGELGVFNLNLTL
jgi:hypothetical protein